VLADPGMRRPEAIADLLPHLVGVREIAGVGARVADDLEVFVERLEHFERVRRRPAELLGEKLRRLLEVERQRRALSALRPGVLHRVGARRQRGLGEPRDELLGPERLALAVFENLRATEEFFPIVGRGVGIEVGLGHHAIEHAVRLPEILRFEKRDGAVALVEERERGRLYAADAPHAPVVGAARERLGGQHGLVHAGEPVGLVARVARLAETVALAERTPPAVRVAKRLFGHLLHPHARERGLRAIDAGVPENLAEDQLALAPGIAGVDDLAALVRAQVAAERFERALGLFARHLVEVPAGLGQDREVGDAPFAVLFAVHRIVSLGLGQLEEMAGGAGDGELVAERRAPAKQFAALLLHAEQRPRDIEGDGRFFGDNEDLHLRRTIVGTRATESSGAFRQREKCAAPQPAASRSTSSMAAWSRPLLAT